MKYELAKKLKDAGFPQRFKTGSFYADKENADFERMQEAMFYFGEEREAGTPEEALVTEQCISIPTLEELIEACGGRCTYLWKTVDGWVAGEAQKRGDNAMFDAKYTECSGQTPEEAVAKLWLEIKKKSK